MTGEDDTPAPSVPPQHRSEATARDSARVYQATGDITVYEAAPTAPVLSAAPPPQPPLMYLSTPCMLPQDVDVFTNRTELIALLDTLLDGTAETRATVVTIGGTGGIGKTALAVHWAYRVADRFPDGQLYADLRGYSAGARPLQPEEVLGRFLRGLGVAPDLVPVDVEEQAGVYRALLANRRMLILLDNVPADAELIRPLIPGRTGSLVLITSRSDLQGLRVSHHPVALDLDVLDPRASLDLLARILGRERVEAEAAPAARLVELAAGLPLALRIAAATLSGRPRGRIADYVTRLEGTDRLGVLEISGDPRSAVSAAFDLSYEALTTRARTVFRRLGLVPGPDVTVETAAALTDGDLTGAAAALDELFAAHLLEYRSDGRYAFHDLLRLYARNRMEREEGPAAGTEALGALYRHLTRVTHGAVGRLAPGSLRLDLPPALAGGDPPPGPSFPDERAALAWLDAERVNLVAAVVHSAEHGPADPGWRLAEMLRGYFADQGHGGDWLRTGIAGARAAAVDGGTRARAALHLSLAEAHTKFGSDEEGLSHGRAALAESRADAWTEGETEALSQLGFGFRRVGRLDEALEHHTRALELTRRHGTPADQARCLNNLGNLYWDLGDLEHALARFVEVLDINRGLGSRLYEAISLDNVGSVYWALGRLPLADEHLSGAVGAYAELSVPQYEADARAALARVLRDLGRHEEALAQASTAYELVSGTGHRWLESYVLSILGSVLRLRRDLAGAGERIGQALRLAEEANYPRGEATARIELAALHRDHERDRPAVREAEKAAEIAGAAGYRVLEGQALTELAGALQAAGRTDRASEVAGRALEAHRSTGHRLGAARTLVVLGDCAAEADPGLARERWEQAWALLTEASAAPEAAVLRARLDGEA
ncbi:ATP-binding protein [Streptomyces sp. NPDC059989]|uniref:ATP-binding protein n=1 Tax=Streptomyces sp. NPDC059989 TaxID=3347026 RepID=UPI0036AD3FD9